MQFVSFMWYPNFSQSLKVYVINTRLVNDLQETELLKYVLQKPNGKNL